MTTTTETYIVIVAHAVCIPVGTYVAVRRYDTGEG
jgi:hypothetical protein